MSKLSKRVLFWALFAVTMAIYIVMLTWTLPTIAAAAGGLPAFDMRPQGYSLDDARAFLAALSSEGLALYRNVQLKLDTFYPGLLALLLALAIRALLPHRFGHWRWLALVFAAPVAIFDYLENAGIDAMLAQGPSLAPELVAATNQWTLLKAQWSTLVMSALLVLLVVRLGQSAWQRFRPA